MSKVAIYLRVSSTEQTTENQVPALEDWVRSRGHDLVAVYEEEESAWRNGHQAKLAECLQDIRGGRRRVDILLVWSLDRLSRTGAAAILNLVNTLRTYRVQVVSLQEPWTEMPGEAGEILYAVAGWVARMESERRSQRTRAGLERVKATGKRLGRPPGAKDKRQRKRRRSDTIPSR